MKDADKQIRDWQEHVRESFGDEKKLYEYLFSTMDNFYYRYIETSQSKNLKTSQLRPGTFGALSFETSMVDALKAPNPEARAHIIELAKRIPKAQNPAVRYGLWVDVLELTAERGHLRFSSEINWGFPDYQDSSMYMQKKVDFQYADLADFRKHLALRLEEVCELF